MSTKSNEAVTLVAENTYEIIRTSAVRKLISYPTHYLLVTDDSGQPASYILDVVAFEANYIREYGRGEDEVTHRAYIALALFRAVLEGGRTFHVLGKGSAEALTTP
jgi:hypothetical protein